MKSAGFPVTLIERVGDHYNNPGDVVDGQAVPGTNADLVTVLLPYLQAGWRAP
jgi:hypothetical protein